jgi:hypothetical protein
MGWILLHTEVNRNSVGQIWTTSVSSNASPQKLNTPMEIYRIPVVKLHAFHQVNVIYFDFIMCFVLDEVVDFRDLSSDIGVVLIGSSFPL